MKLRNVIDKELVKEPTNKRQPTTIEQSKQINLSDNLKLFIACNNRQGDTSKPWLPQDVIREIVKFTLLSEDIAIFLNLVVEGEQDQAEAMLRQTPELALCPGIVTDLSGRIFDNITGFQYAAWALDSHMWRMIRKYLPNAAAREQVKGLKTGLWVAQHGESASWQNLIDALDGVIKLCNQNEYNAADVKWRRDVGDAQLLLPVHVVNQYCHPKRSFYPCPDFNDQSPLPRSRETDEGEWFTCTYNGGKLGKNCFASVRGGRLGSVSLRRLLRCNAEMIVHDHAALVIYMTSQTKLSNELLVDIKKQDQRLTM
jgi:hypothetical protein